MAWRMHLSPMALQLEAITKEARGWPRAQRLALARVLLEPETNNGSPAAEAAWDEEIRARVLAVEEGQAVGVPYEEVRQQMQARFAP